MPAYPAQRRWRPKPRGLKQCAVCPRKVPALQQFDRWIYGRIVTVCDKCHRLSADQLHQILQQQLSVTNDGEPQSN